MVKGANAIGIRPPFIRLLSPLCAKTESLKDWGVCHDLREFLLLDPCAFLHSSIMHARKELLESRTGGSVPLQSGPERSGSLTGVSRVSRDRRWFAAKSISSPFEYLFSLLETPCAAAQCGATMPGICQTQHWRYCCEDDSEGQL